MFRTITLILLLTFRATHADTLKQLLQSQKIPLSAFQELELNESVSGVGADQKDLAFLAYQQVKNNTLTGPLHLVIYSHATAAIRRKDLPVSDTGVCPGSPDHIQFIDEFILYSSSLSPSAECLLVLDRNLRLRKTLYGFGPLQIAPGQIVFIENMVHFSPVHPERLQFADLRTGATTELYPPKDDALRARLASENAAHMPSDETCMRMNDPCKPEEFDEDISSMGTDGKGRFAFIAVQSAQHAVQENKPSEIVPSQVVLYVYERRRNGWFYCQREIDDSEARSLQDELSSHFDQVAVRCAPALHVVPDLSTARYNPFSTQP